MSEPTRYGGARERVVHRVYDPSLADQLQFSERDDITPTNADGRIALATSAAIQAVIYGMPSVLQYASMCAMCAPAVEGDPWRMNVLRHDREIASHGYQPFRVPNVDTLYSNAWIDLSDGPVRVDLPDFGRRYFTLNLLDAYSNASNVSARTHTPPPRELLIATTTWTGTAPDGTPVLRVATPLMWLLMRIQVFDTPGDVDTVRALQDQVLLHGRGDSVRPWPVVGQDEVETSVSAFLRALDASLRINGVPHEDVAHVDQFRILGIGSGASAEPLGRDEAVAEGARRGFESAMRILGGSRGLLGRKAESGWTRVLDKGSHGNNFLARAVMNFVGLGANVVEENCSYNTYVDSGGAPLDGSGRAVYRIDLSDPPPAEAFWSITLYEAETGRLHDAPAGRHSVGGSTNRADDGRAPSAVVVSAGRPESPDAAWLPCPEGAFFLVLRIYQPLRAALDETWTPPPVRLVT
ncbi:DUF1254 domain-containing protein [Williamsia sp. SKLECPSW1]